MVIKLFQHTPIYIPVHYNPPSYSEYRLSSHELKEFFANLSNIMNFGRTILVGDFNLPGADWGVHYSENDYETFSSTQ